MYKIDAVDTLTFRGANPYDAGVNFHSASLFPPSPATYAGAFKNKNELKDRELKVGFNGLMLDNEYAFPQPLDTIVVNDYIHTMHLEKSSHSSHELAYKLVPSQKVDKKLKIPGGAYLKLSAFAEYLEGTEQQAYVALGDFITKETHTGIAMKCDTHTTEEGMWYTEESIRLKTSNHTCSLVTDVIEKSPLVDGDIVKLGANQRLATVTKTDGLTINGPKTSKYFKLYFATPAILKHGWLPRWLDPVTKEGVFTHKRRRVKLKLLAAAIGKPVPIGGYSNNGPRQMHLAIPAGSVYYFEVLEGKLENIEKLFHQKCISDYRNQLGFDYEWWSRLVYCDRGFGYTIVSSVEEEIFK